MKITNKYDLPLPLARALQGDLGEFYINWPYVSLTVLLMPIQQSVLMHRHSSEIEEDVSDRIWLLLGGAMHSALEIKKDSRYLIEVPCRLELPNGVTVGMRADVIESEGILSDYKITSVWSAVFRNEQDEYLNAMQLNPYRIALERSWGMSFEKLRIINIYRDWQKSKKNDQGYPSIPFGVYDIPILPEQEVIDTLTLRTGHLEIALSTEDENALPECSEIDRWAKPTKYALMKEGRKSAIKLFDTMDAANQGLQEQLAKVGGDYYVETRRGKNTRCDDYCAAMPFCQQYKRLTKGG